MISTSTLLLLITSLVVFITAHKLYITPDDHPSASDNNTLFLSHVLSHPTKYLISSTKLFLAPGWYYLKTDFMIQGVSNIAIIGNRSTIQCANSSVGIAIINVTNIVMLNLEISKCSKNHSTAPTLDQYMMICQNFIGGQHYSYTIVC